MKNMVINCSLCLYETEQEEAYIAIRAILGETSFSGECLNAGTD